MWLQNVLFNPRCFYCYSSTYVYLLQVQKQIFEAGFNVDVELDPSNTFNKKVRNAQLAQYNFIFGMYMIIFTLS